MLAYNEIFRFPVNYNFVIFYSIDPWSSATTLSMKALSITTFSIMTFSITKFSITTFSITTLNKKGL